MMKHLRLLFLLFTAAFLLAACGASEPNDTPPTNGDTGDTGDFIYGEAMIETVDLAILESFPVQVHLTVKGYLPDGCTFLDEIKQERTGNEIVVTVTTRRDAEAMCTMALVDFEERVSLNVYGLPAGEYTVKVNDAATSFRLDVDNTLSGAGDNPAVNAIVGGLARELGIAPEAIIVQSVKPVEWPDSCLGIRTEGIACADVITPGYIIQLDVSGVVMVFHSNEDGSNTILTVATE